MLDLLPNKGEQGQIEPLVRLRGRLRKDVTGWLPSIKRVLILYLAIVFILLALTFSPRFPFFVGGATRLLVGPDYPFYWLWHYWDHYDTEHYLNIAISGYSFGRSVFFPLYPFLIHLVMTVIPDPLIAALLVAHLSSLILLIVFDRLAREEWGEEVGKRVIWYLLAFPTACFLWVAYTESLFLCLIILGLYAMKRRSWWIAGCLGALVSATRPNGVFIGVLFAFEYFRQREWSWRAIRWDIFSLLLVPMGLFLFMLFCYLNYGDWLTFINVQKGWLRVYHFPGMNMVKLIEQGFQESIWAIQLNALMDLLPDILVLIILILGVIKVSHLGKMHWSYLFYGVMIWLILNSTSPGGQNSPVMSVGRFMLTIFPIYPLLAQLGARSRWFHWLYLGTGGIFCILWMSRFLAGLGVL